MHQFRTNGTCSETISFDIQDGIITKCKFTRGCSGNLQGVSRLVIGRRPEEVIDLCRGIKCQNGTSCPDQLAIALERYLAEHPTPPPEAP